MNKRVQTTTAIIEIALELQKAIVEGQEREQIDRLTARLADLIFEADPETIQGVKECLRQITL